MKNEEFEQLTESVIGNIISDLDGVCLTSNMTNGQRKRMFAHVVYHIARTAALRQATVSTRGSGLGLDPDEYRENCYKLMDEILEGFFCGVPTSQSANIAGISLKDYSGYLYAKERL